MVMYAAMAPIRRFRSQPNREFGLYVKRLRERALLSQRDLAKRAGISTGYPAQIEAGRIPSDEILTAIAPLLGTTYDDLAERAGINRPTGGEVTVVHVPADEGVSDRRRVAHLPLKALRLFLAQYDAASRSDDAALREAMGLNDPDAPRAGP